MTTVLFIHGTGVREREFTATFGRIKAGLAEVRPDILTESCYWGEIGAKLLAGGKSFSFGSAPTRETGGAAEQREPLNSQPGEYGVPEQEKELARWAQLFVDPLFEIRLRQIANPDDDGDSDDPFDPTLRERVLALPGKPEVAAGFASYDLLDTFDRAVIWVTDSDEFVSAFDNATTADGNTEEMLSRALVARCLATAAEQDGIELAGQGREELLAAVRAGFGVLDYGIGDDLGDLAKNLAFRTVEPSLRRRRRDYIQKTGDILLYQARGEAIRRYVRERIRQVPGPIVLLAHSLGGIAAFDLLAGQCATDLDQVRMLITVGSQVPLLYELGALSSGITYPKGLPEDFRPLWVNVYDERDLLAYVGGELFGNRCRDLRVDTGTPFPTAHGAYWDKKAGLYRRLAEVMKQEGL